MIGDNIYKLRKQRGLTLSELAERAKISKLYLSNIERNLNKNLSIQIIEKIAGILQVDIATLLNSEIEEVASILLHELKESGIKIEDVRDNLVLIEFIKSRQENK